MASFGRSRPGLDPGKETVRPRASRGDPWKVPQAAFTGQRVWHASAPGIAEKEFP